jgi:hypothetical protein
VRAAGHGGGVGGLGRQGAAGGVLLVGEDGREPDETQAADAVLDPDEVVGFQGDALKTPENIDRNKKVRK